MRRRGVRPALMRDVLRELSDFRSRNNFTGRELAEIFPFSKGGKEGCVDAPELFSVVARNLLEDSVASWNDRGLGGSFVDGPPPISRLIWRGNIWLLARSRDDLITVITNIATSIYAGGFGWKPTSLQTKAGGDASQKDVVGIKCAGSGSEASSL